MNSGRASGIPERCKVSRNIHSGGDSKRVSLKKGNYKKLSKIIRKLLTKCTNFCYYKILSERKLDIISRLNFEKIIYS